MLSINSSTPFVQRVAVAASINLALSTTALLILLNYPAIGDPSIFFAVTSIGGASFLTILVSCGIIQSQKKRQITQESIVDSSLINNLLPYEVLTHIFAYLSPRQRILCSLICRTWHEAVEADNNFWRQVYIREQLPISSQWNLKKACVLFPIFLKKFFAFQSNREQLLRYQEWNFQIQGHFIDKYENGNKVGSLQGSSKSSLSTIIIVNDSIFGLRENYVVDEWNCESGNHVRTIEPSLAKSYKKENVDKKSHHPLSLLKLKKNG